MLVGTSQPFYPVYVRWLVGPAVWPTFLTLAFTPFFLAVPAVVRRHPRLGRALLPVTGIANTVLCAKAFGVGSGVEVFLLPCIALALLLFRRSEWPASTPIVGLALAVGLLLHGRYGPPVHVYSATELDAFARLNLGSAATLTAALAYRCSALFEDDAAAAPRGPPRRPGRASPPA